MTLPPTILNNRYECLGQRAMEGAYPKWRVDPYDRIYNRYFKHPTDDDKTLFPNSPTKDMTRFRSGMLP